MMRFRRKRKSKEKKVTERDTSPQTPVAENGAVSSTDIKKAGCKGRIHTDRVFSFVLGYHFVSPAQHLRDRSRYHAAGTMAQ